MRINSGQASSTLIPEYIGSDFDKVVEVADNIEYVKDVAAGIEGLPVHGYIGETPPLQPLAGAEWYCTTDGRTYVWYVDDDSSQWVESSPQSTVETDPSTTDNIFTLWKRSAAEAGLDLVAGSFEEGGVLTSSTDVLLHKESKSIYAWSSAFPHNVAKGTNPTAAGSGYVPRTDVVLRDALAGDGGAELSLSQVATNYRVPFDKLSKWVSGDVVSVGDYRWFNNEVWGPNANGLTCGLTPSYSNFHTVRPDKLLTPENFGATDTAASQDAVNRLFVYATNHSIGLAYIDKQYLVSPSAHAGLSGTFGTNSVCLNLLSNLKIWGPGGFKLIDGASGTSGAILGNWDGVTISDCSVDIDIDGNKANTSGTVSGLVFVNGERCQFINGRKIVNTTFNGLQFAKYSLACVADRPYISGCGYIGIQAQKPDGLQILFPRVYSVEDNAIDIEANGASSDQTQIVGPTINGCNSGIFLESTGNVIVTGGTIEVCRSYAIILNQITTSSNKNIISGVKMKKGAGTATVAVYINNNSGYTSIFGCRFEDWTNSINLNVAVGVHVGVNNHSGITGSLIKISRATNALVRSYVDEQILETQRSSGKPFCCSPIGNPLNSGDRDFLCTIKPMRELYTNTVNASSDIDYVAKTSTLVQNPAWGNAYSVYSGGETLIYITTNTPTVGRYIYINNTLYYVYSSPSGGVYAIRDSNQVAGNFVANVNSNYSTTEYYAEYMTQ